MQTCEFFVIQQLGPLSDWWMLAMVGGIILIDVALLTAWELADRLTYEKYNFTEEVRKINENSQKDKDCCCCCCLITGLETNFSAC